LLAGSARAETYRWTDDGGVVHFSDNYDRIPSRYQQKATVERDMSSVNIMPASRAPERATAEPGAAAQPRLDTSPAKKKNTKNSTHKKHAKKEHRKAKQVVKSPAVAATPARQAQDKADPEDTGRDDGALT